ncbi:MAG: outer membrane lipoprotein LolB [Gammaproteobacteria bacterium]|nr:outer membrane lipoprotein LolB [Gammaproteobacteria bacterium]
MIRGLVLVCGILLTGCATAPPPAPAPDTNGIAWHTRQTTLAALSHWTLDGRLAIQRGQEGGQARLRWTQSGQDFELRIMAPLSQGTYVIRSAPAGVELVAPDNTVYHARDLDALMTTHLHWALPVAGAQYWVRGIPDPAQPVANLQLDATGRLQDLAQAGWRVSVLEYQARQDVDLPAKLFILGNDLQLRLAITQWTLNPP